jgi:uncharacterized protein DUF6599
LRFSRVILYLGLSLSFAVLTFADTPSDASQPLPATIGKFRKVSVIALSFSKEQNVSEPLASETAEYVGSNGGRAYVEISRLRQDAQAYAALSTAAASVRALAKSSVDIVNNIGTAGFATEDEIAFFKGQHFVRIKKVKGNPANLNELAQNLSETLDKGEGEIPPLVKHLPALEVTQKNAVFANSFTTLPQFPFDHPVLSAVHSDGNADAVLGTYGPSKILIIEFNTPQLATDNDQRIKDRIQELQRLGQPAPSAYRRVGNYSVFVFDAPDDMMANYLINQVKYEQVVQWLGDNPNIYKDAEKRYINTTLGVLVTVVKASGYAALACFGLGGLIGGLLFSYRRSQQKEATAYSDAGGMLRLNLDELTPETNPRRLLRERN